MRCAACSPSWSAPLEDGGYLRRAVPPDELGPIALELARTRLVTLGPDTVELVHEALVRHWDRLRGWVEQDREFRLWQDELDRQATRWRDTRERALLLRGKALQHAWATTAQRHDDVTERQREFVTASAKGYVVRLATVVLSAGLVLGLAFGVVYTVVVLISQQNVVSAENAVSALRARAEESPFDQRVFDALRAHRTSDTLYTRQSLRSLSRSLRHAVLLLRPTSVVNARGSRLARQLPDGRVELWDLAAASAIDVPGLPTGATLTWTGDDALVVTAAGHPLVVTENLAPRPGPTRTRCDGDRLRLEDAFTGAVTAEVRPSDQACESGAFSPDGRAFEMVYRNPYINPSMLQYGATDPDGPRYVAQVPNDALVTHLEVEPSGAHRVLLAVDGSALLLRIPPPDDLERALDTAHDARFTPDGRHVVLHGSDVEVWHVDSRTRTGRIEGRAEDVALDSATLAVRGEDGRITLWNLPDLAPLGDVPGPPDDVWLRFLDPGRLVVVRGQEVGVWSARTGEPIGRPFTAVGKAPLSAVAVGADQLAVVSADKWVRWHAIADGGEVPGSAFTFGGPPARSPDEPLAVDADGELLAVPVADGVEVWDLARGERLERLDVQADFEVTDLRFRDDPDEVEVTVDGVDGGGQADGGVLVELWTRDVLWGLPGLLGRDDETVERLAVPAVPGYANAGGEYGGLESGDPAAWRDVVCGVVTRSGLSEGDVEPPAGSFDGPVC
ncbi:MULTISPECIES: WD40 repeat domain-containing protein [Saccharothrix]|uniref:WD40 repeat domain-containing protein n=1 Tax=Saccharothrix TaxID=2071 RepID=UPI000939CB5B|nr:WD40 repeat domain-containing protein [Saccharothrix sp. CB00851]OKI38674.1 hypothetical protein A6A25_00140 [Saccharothrix sp. CB00851]